MNHVYHIVLWQFIVAVIVGYVSGQIVGSVVGKLIQRRRARRNVKLLADQFLLFTDEKIDRWEEEGGQ